MQTATGTFASIVTGNEAVTAVKVTIGWPAAVPAAYQSLSELAVQSCRPIRETQTDMPDGTRYVTGRAAASCDITLAGLVDRTDDTKTIAWLVGQYSATSPMYRIPATGLTVTVDEGVLTGGAGLTTPDLEGVEFIRVFTGVIDDYSVDDVAGTVTMTCLDNRALLSGTATISNVALAISSYPPRGDSAMDIILRPTFLTWPAVRSQAIFACGFRGTFAADLGVFATVVPTLGWDGTRYVNTAIGFAQGAFGAAVTSLGGSSWAVTGNAGNDFFIEMWVTNLGGGVNASVSASGPTGRPGVQLLYTTGTQDLVTMQGIGGTTLSPTSTGATVLVPHLAVGASVYVAAQLNWSGTSYTLTIRCGGTSYTASGTGAANRSALGTVNTAGVLVSQGAVEAVQVTLEAAGAPWNDTFTPTAVIDTSLNVLTAYPDISGQDRWQAVQDIALAELGVAGFDENGVFRFRNRNTVNNSAAVRTITRANSLVSAVAQTARASSGINHVQVPVNKLQIGPLSFVWSAADVIQVPARGTYTQLITTTSPVINVPAADSGEQPSGGGTMGNTYWRACRDPAGAGPRISTGITITCVQLAPTQVQMTINNSNPFIAYLVTPIGAGFPTAQNGLPAVNIGGQLITTVSSAADGTTLTNSGVTVEATYGSTPSNDVLLALAQNVWRQDVVTAQQLANDLLSDLHRAKPLFQQMTVVCDPRLQRGDRVSIEVADGLFQDALIQNIQINDDWTMGLDLRATSAPGIWLLGVPGRTELGVTTYT
jgi:hypothetical protein